MKRLGVYRSVEYVVESLTLDGSEIDTTDRLPPAKRPDVIATLRPLNPLLPRFERRWPVAVSLKDAKLWSYKQDLISCTMVTLAVSAMFVLSSLKAPDVMGIYSIPSHSMEPSLRVGDALLVEKISLLSVPPHRGEIVLFHPTSRLMKIFAEADPEQRLRRNDLFVKRVVATSGDIIAIMKGGVFVNGVRVDDAVPQSPYVTPHKIPEGYVFVVGDNPDHSVDSRYWGLLPVDCVVGRPIARIFPLDRFDCDV